MSSHKIFTTAPFYVDDVPLGTLVPDVRYPNQDALIVYATVPTEHFSKRPQHKLQGSLENEKNRSLVMQLTKLLRLSAGKSKQDNLFLKAEAGWIYELRQPKAYFKEICSKDEVRVWLREGLEQQLDSYFVLGLRTFQNTSVGKGEKDAKQLGLSATVPVGEVVRANTGVDIGDAANVKVDIDTSEKHDGSEAFETSEELVYAIEYRKILMKKRDPNSPPVLDKDNVWRYYSDNRVASGGGEWPYEEFEVVLDDENLQFDGPLECINDVDGEPVLLLDKQA
jgi:hypothetical protein